MSDHKPCRTCAHRLPYTCRYQPPKCRLQRSEVREGYGCIQHQEIKTCCVETVDTTPT